MKPWPILAALILLASATSMGALGGWTIRSWRADAAEARLQAAQARALADQRAADLAAATEATRILQRAATIQQAAREAQAADDAAWQHTVLDPIHAQEGANAPLPDYLAGAAGKLWP